MTDPGAGQPGAGPPGPGQPGLPVRVRFAPSPSAPLHVSDVRTALYAWAFARHTGGTFVLRIADTNQAQDAPEHVAAVADTLHWLGLAWDEGPDQGGPFGPYRQSERIGLYHQVAQQFLDTGQAYWCYCSPEELQGRRAAQAAHGQDGAPGEAGSAAADYDRYCRTLTQQQAEAYLAEGRQPVLRFRMPDGATTFTDLARGPVTVQHRDVPDFVLMRGDGHPLPTLVTAVDDAVMRITHVIRDEALLPFTPRQIAVYRAMGLPEDQFPAFAHLPRILGADQQTLTRHNGVTSIEVYRREGYVPEALVSYLALLGWSPGPGPGSGPSRPDGGAAHFGLDELVGGFDLTGLGTDPVQFDPARLEAVNGAEISALSPADFARRIVPFLASAGLVTEPLSSDQMWFIRQGAPLVQDQLTRLTEAPGLLAFLLVPESGFTVRAEDAAVLTPDAATTLKAAAAALAALPEWTAPALGQALSSALADSSGAVPDPALAAIAVAVTGRRAAPPLPETLELLGRDRTLARLAAAEAAAQTSR